MSTDRTTRAELRAEIAARDANAQKLVAEIEAWKKVAPNDAEAHAIAACVLALSKLPRTTSSGYSSSTSPDVVAVKRVLGYLAQRFGG